MKKNCLLCNAFVFRSEADFKKIGVGLIFVSWLSHIMCCTVKHTHKKKVTVGVNASEGDHRRRSGRERTPRVSVMPVWTTNTPMRHKQGVAVGKMPLNASRRRGLSSSLWPTKNPQTAALVICLHKLESH